MLVSSDFLTKFGAKKVVTKGEFHQFVHVYNNAHQSDWAVRLECRLHLTHHKMILLFPHKLISKEMSEEKRTVCTQKLSKEF